MYIFEPVVELYICCRLLICRREGGPAGGGEGGGGALRFSGFLSGGLPEWGHLSNLGMGSGCSGPFGYLVGFVRRFVSW